MHIFNIHIIRNMNPNYRYAKNEDTDVFTFTLLQQDCTQIKRHWCVRPKSEGSVSPV